MLRTRFCELFDIEAPLLQAAIWPATVPELVAAVSEAGGLGSIGAVFGSADLVRGQIERVRELTDKPFVVNHVVPLLDEEAFEATLEAPPRRCRSRWGTPAASSSERTRPGRRRSTRCTPLARLATRRRSGST
jgi:enoyl-[acyl-carrier protein] reductase II